MNQVRHILRKDLAHFWPLWLLVIALTASHARQSLFPPSTSILIGGAFGVINALVGIGSFLLPVGWMACVVLVIQDESLVGSNAFWLTRPHSRLALVCEKTILIVLFIFLPMLVHDFFVVHWFGFSMTSALPLILFKDLELAAFLICVAALAVLTSTFTRFTGLLLAILVAYFLIVSMSFHDYASDSSMPFILSIFVATAGAGIVIANQYRTRHITRSVLFGSIGLIATVSVLFIPSNVAGSMTSWTEPAASNLRPVRIFPVLHASFSPSNQSPDQFTLLQKFQVEGLTGDLTLNTLGVNAELRFASPSANSSFKLTAIESPTFLSGSDQSLRLGMLPRAAFQQYRTEQALITGTFYLEAYRHVKSLSVPMSEQETPLQIMRQRCTSLAFVDARTMLNVMVTCAELEPASGARLSASLLDLNGRPVGQTQPTYAGEQSAFLPALMDPIHQTVYSFQFTSTGADAKTLIRSTHVRFDISEPVGLIRRDFRITAPNLQDLEKQLPK